MSSALESRPKLREDLKIVRREVRGKVHYIVKLPAEGKYFQFGETEVRLMELMDGRRTPERIADAAREVLGARPHAGQVADFAHRLKRLGLVERTPVEKHLMLMEHLRAQRKVRTRRRAKGSILRLTFSIGDPDRWFERVVARLGWVWSPAFVGASVALFAVYFLILGYRWDEFWEGTAGLVTLSGFGATDWILFYLIVLVVSVIHELGHGLTTKYFGGEVHEIGAMVLYFSPALFCNTNDAWTFERRSHRLWVTFAGPWIELVLTALAAIVWVTTEPGTLLHLLAFLAVLAGGIVAVVMNFNPLLPLDGYYALSDWLEIPNLRGRAFAYWGWIGKRFLLGVDAPPPPATPRERRILIVYGGLALLYSALTVALSLWWLISVVGRFLGPWVWVILAVIAGRVVLRLAGRSRMLALAASTAWQAGFLRGRRAALLTAGTVLLVGLPFAIPWTLRARGEFLVEAAPRVQVRAEAPGMLDRLHVREGDTVSAGQSLATLWSPELEATFAAAVARLERLRLTRAQGGSRDDLPMAASAEASLEGAQREFEVVRAEREHLAILSPIDGVVLGYRLREHLGQAVERGELLLEVAPIDARTARVRVPMKWAGELAAGQRANLKLSAAAHLKFRGTVARVAPAAEEGWLEVEVPFPTGGWLPAPGMIGIAKIATRRTTVAGAIVRAWRQTVRSELWL
ncbi:MAG: HlyD family efflux transporter periplasmic adaptor subunit [Gemmatimonadota bacterium]